ncbi:PH domain-containing protein [Salinifilum aidingensis]
MAYPDALLGEDEDVVVHAHPHWKKLVLPVLVLFAVVGGGSYLAALAAPLSWHAIAWGALGVLAAVILVPATLTPVLRRQTTHFVVTTHRIMVREGVFTRSGVDIPLQRVNSVQFRHGLVDRIFGCGTLVVESASENPLEFEDIPHVEQVYTRLYQEVPAPGGEDHGRRDAVEER